MCVFFCCFCVFAFFKGKIKKFVFFVFLQNEKNNCILRLNRQNCWWLILLFELKITFQSLSLTFLFLILNEPLSLSLFAWNIPRRCLSYYLFPVPDSPAMWTGLAYSGLCSWMRCAASCAWIGRSRFFLSENLHNDASVLWILLQNQFYLFSIKRRTKPLIPCHIPSLDFL